MKKQICLSLACSIIFLLSCAEQSKTIQKIYSPANFWKDGYFHQTNVFTPAPEDSIIKAKLDGKWQEFSLQKFPEKFMEWNISKRLETIGIIEEMMASKGKPSKGPELAGPHNGIVASYGFRRKDSKFKLNNAVKGMGFLPKKEKIREIIKLLEETIDAPFPEKLKNLIHFYENVDSLFDVDKLVSLELYSTPEFETQTFLNQMTNPISTIVFLDIPSYKLKTIVRLLHPDDPNLTEYEKDVVKYINLIHSYFHGKFPRDYIAVIYYVVEIYDNSPGRMDAMGRRIE
ncbi:MAG: hypothetical protein H8D22_12290 [Candidatus Cloacimonetes bacterium]|nr:hypothetical protein [Candidatus Cloacimonadota bacterium]